MSRFCKAYPAAQFARFSAWAPNIDRSNPILERDKEGRNAASGDDEYFFLHDTLVVTRGIDADQDVVFSTQAPQWKQFCIEQLNFVAPSHIEASE
jgi:hypothetical protein